MQILLEKPELEQFIRDNVDRGRYTSATQVVEAALRLMMTEDFEPGELDRLIAEGEASIREEGLIPADQVFTELREKHRQARSRASK